MIIYQSRIYRADLQANPDVLYVFGDNVKRVGLGGQAKEMRGEPNAVGVATKWSPGNHPNDYFSDTQLEKCRYIIWSDCNRLGEHHRDGGIIIVPLDGIGTGLSELPQRAPEVYKLICKLGLGAQNE